MRGLLIAIVIVSAFTASIVLRSHLPGDVGPQASAQWTFPDSGRIASLSPGLTETLFALGLGDQVVGVTRFCAYPPEARECTRVGGLLDPNYEALVAVRPDLVLITPFHRDQKGELERLGLHCEVVAQDTVADIRASFARVGTLCGREGAALSLTENMDARFGVVAERIAGRPRPRVLMVTSRNLQRTRIEEVYAVSTGSFLSDLLVLAGGENCVSGAVAEYPALSAEGILQLDPEVILELTEKDPGPMLDAVLAPWRSLSGLRAVRDGRIHILGGPQYTIPGPRTVQTLEAIARFLHPELEWPQ